MRQSKAITGLTKATTALIIAVLAIICLPITPAQAGGALMPGTADYNVLAQKSVYFANFNWHLISAHNYCWFNSKPQAVYTYEYDANESFLIIENIDTGQTVTWRWTPSQGWHLA